MPLGRRQEVGIVVALHNQTDIAENKQKSLIHLFSETAPLSDIWLKLTKFASDYYQHGWGEVAIASLPTFFRSKPGPRYQQSLDRLRKPYKVKETEQKNVWLKLNDEQRRAVEGLDKAKGFSPFVLHGVTGSGKTEVYLKMMDNLFIRQPQAQVLFLVPEINLTPQLEERIRSHFPGIGLLHHCILGWQTESVLEPGWPDMKSVSRF